MTAPAPFRAEALLILFAAGAAAVLPRQEDAALRYRGSSTVAVFVRDAASAYGAARFEIDTRGESDGGEAAILAGETDVAGIARPPRPQTLRAGVAATLIGRDAIAVIVHPENPLRSFTRSQLRDLFTGRVRSWRELGGADRAVLPLIVAPDSATRGVFRTMVLGEEDYRGCEEVRPDRAIVDRVAETPGAIGHISFSFLEGGARVRAVAVDGEAAAETNFAYPIARPLYLLWREGDPRVEAFVDWTQSDEGQRTVMRHFVGTRVVGSVPAAESAPPSGILVVYTETYPVYDGGIYYYPHRPYEIWTRGGERVRRVRNHRGENDEAPMRIALAPGVYLIRPETTRAEGAEILVTIEPGKTTEVHVQEILRRRR